MFLVKDDDKAEPPFPPMPHFRLASYPEANHATPPCEPVERTPSAEGLEKQSERLRLLWESAAVVLTTDQPDAMLRALFARIAPHFGLDTYFNYLVNDAGDALRLESCDGIPEETAHALRRLEFGQAICGTVALKRRPLVATCIQQSDDPKAQLVKSLGLRAYVCYPLLPGGRLLGTLSFASRTRDQFEADELEFLRTLCQYVAAAYERLHLIDQLREADRRKDDFLAVLAHELRNPLAPIRNALHIFKQPGADRAVVEHVGEIMRRQVQHMTRMVEDLLDVSRISHGKIDLRMEVVDLASVLSRAVEASRPLLSDRHQELRVDLPHEPVYLEADPTRLEQVVTNLLNNAAKYTHPSGRIWLQVQQEGNQIVLRVKDNGIGIASEMLSAIFDPFVQLERGAHHSQGGLGIGLTLVRSLVELHGGTVQAHSAGPGQGSAFVVCLPALARREKTGEARTAGRGPPRVDGTPKCHILVVDDNVDAAESLALLLRLEGHVVRVARDGPAALAAVDTDPPDLVFLDIGMPVMDGYEVAQRLRQRPGLDKLLLVALTGWGQQEDVRRSQEAGFDHHLVKPTEPEALYQLLARARSVPGERSRFAGQSGLGSVTATAGGDLAMEVS